MLLCITRYSHGALYKVLGEMEIRQKQYLKARETFAKGLSLDSHCAPLYHAAALMEAKLGNLGVCFSLIPYMHIPLCHFATLSTLVVTRVFLILLAYNFGYLGASNCYSTDTI